MIIELKNIYKSFFSLKEENVLFDNLNLKIEKGEMLGISGPSGSGKSSLLHILGLLSVPQRGSIVFDNIIYNFENSKNDSLWSEGRKKIGFIYQFHHLLPEFSVEENLIIPLSICGINRLAAEKKVEEILKKIGLFHLSKRKPSQMSGGENQRISILRSIIKNPILILADEPTGSLDEKNSEILFNFLLEIINEYNLTLILSSHNQDLIKKFPRILEI
jgi:lipoprotein-releasing system ATP-binding protein